METLKQQSPNCLSPGADISKAEAKDFLQSKLISPDGDGEKKSLR